MTDALASATSFLTSNFCAVLEATCFFQCPRTSTYESTRRLTDRKSARQPICASSAVSVASQIKEFRRGCLKTTPVGATLGLWFIMKMRPSEHGRQPSTQASICFGWKWWGTEGDAFAECEGADAEDVRGRGRRRKGLRCGRTLRFILKETQQGRQPLSDEELWKPGGRLTQCAGTLWTAKG